MSFVYVITDDPYDHSQPMEVANHVKIGYTSDSNVHNRIKQLQTGNPRPLRIIEIMEFENSDMARQIERLCHWNLGEFRMTGEWFRYTGEVIDKLACIAELSNYYPASRMAEFNIKYPKAKFEQYP